MNLRALEPKDIPAVLSIQGSSAEASQWLRRDYERVAHGEMQGWVVEGSQGVIGFLVARQIFREIEILNLAVAPTARLQGAGSMLLKEALRWGQSLGATRAFLEVRASNQGALRFYASRAFEVTGRRPNYYSAPVEDALLLSHSLGG